MVAWLNIKASCSHNETLIELLREDPALANEYLAASLEAIDEPGGQEALLSALRQIALAQNLDSMAASIGIQLQNFP